MNETIVRMQFGSHVYGTNLPSSDTDYKSIFIPDGRDLILQRPAKHIQNNTKEDRLARNASTDVDDEAFSLQTFIRLLMEGQTVALDMLFTPDKWYQSTSPQWEEIRAHCKRYLLHSCTSSFVRYTKAQAAKYGLKGGRVDALTYVLEYLNRCDDYRKLSDRPEAIQHLVDCYKAPDDGKESVIQVVNIKSPNGKDEPHLMCANRKVPFSATVKYAKEVYGKILNNYGERAKLAQLNLGVDWKAVMHAIRVSHEAYELLTTGKITFPRPEVGLLLKVRQGQMGIKECETIIEEALFKVEAAKKTSLLPKEPDRGMADCVLFECHLRAISEASGLK